jgi:hypothetical protein
MVFNPFLSEKLGAPSPRLALPRGAEPEVPEATWPSTETSKAHVAKAVPTEVSRNYVLASPVNFVFSDIFYSSLLGITDNPVTRQAVLEHPDSFSFLSLGKIDSETEVREQ